MTNSTLTSHRRRVQKLEAIRAQKSQHVVLVFFGTPEADTHADRLIEEGRAEAERLGKELQVLRIGYRSFSGCLSSEKGIN